MSEHITNQLCKTCNSTIIFGTTFKRFWCSEECYIETHTKTCLICKNIFLSKSIKSIFCTDCIKFEEGNSYNELANMYKTMLYRCFNPSRNKYEFYGGSGITVDSRWFDFSNFLEDMSPRPEGTTIDRIDNTKGYSKENCRWVNINEQRINRRRFKNAKMKYKGVRTHGQKFVSAVRYNKKSIYLGVFNSELEAALAYDNKIKELYPDTYNNYINIKD